MFRKICMSIILLFVGNLLIAENILKNSNFSTKTSVGLPLHWEYRGEKIKGISIDTNLLRLGGGIKPNGSYLIQHNLPLKWGTKYTLSYKVKGTKNSRCRIYIEWRKNSGKSQSVATGFYSVGEQWKIHELTFNYDANSKPAYLVINVKDEGEIELKDLFLELDKSYLLDKSKLLLNANFKIRTRNNRPVGWEFRGEDKLVSYKDNGVLMKGSKGHDLMFVQHNLQLKGGVYYKVSYETKSHATSGTYRLYLGTMKFIDGKRIWKNFNTTFNTTSLQWGKKGFAFKFPENTTTSFLVIEVKQGADIEFRRLSVTAEKKKPVKKQFGGQWHYGGNSSFTKHAGRNVLLVSNNDIAILKGVPLKKGRKYKISYAVTGIGNAGTTTGFHPFKIQVSFDGIKEKTSSSWDDVWNNSFQDKQFSFQIPSSASSEKVDIEFIVKSKGGVCFNKINLQETPISLKEKYKITLSQPCYRNMIFSSMPLAEIKGEVRTDSSITEVKICLKSGNKIIYASNLRNQGELVHFSIPAKEIPVGKYQLEAILTDKNKTSTTIYSQIIKLPPAVVEVVQGANRNFYINGKPFFPIHIETSYFPKGDIELPLYYSSRQGVNTAMKNVSTEKTALEILNLSDKLGIKVILRIGFSENAEGDQLTIWAHRMSNILTKQVIAHPALLGYFLADEACWRGVPLKNLIASYQILKDLDPYHPVWMNAAPRGSVEIHREYSKAADIYGADIYPVPYPNHHSALKDQGLTSVGKYTKRMSEATDNKKAIWMAIQGFSWQEMKATNTYVETARYPTYTELRFMTYDALLNDAKGFWYYGGRHVLHPEFWDIVFKITKEVHDISDLILNGKIIKGAVSDNSKIKCRELEVDGVKYLIAMNTSHNKIKVNISGIFSKQKLHVFRENRAVFIKNNQFSDSFKPLEVHLYGESKLLPAANALPPINPKFNDKINPFHKRIKEYLNLIPYKGKANWIWEKSKIKVANSKVWLNKEFTINKPIKLAKLLVAADDASTVYLNGRLLGDANGFIMTSFDCVQLVKKGKNILSVQAADKGLLPCGLLVDFIIKTTEGEIISIISDDTCGVSNEGQSDKLNQKTAKIVAPYGGGAWGNRVKCPR